jgi:hypothetical protein
MNSREKLLEKFELFEILQSYGNTDFRAFKDLILDIKEVDYKLRVNYNSGDEWISVYGDYECSFHHLKNNDLEVYNRLTMGDIAQRLADKGWYFQGYLRDHRSEKVLDRGFLYKKTKVFLNMAQVDYKDHKKELKKLENNLVQYNIVLDNLKDNQFIKLFNKTTDYGTFDIVPVCKEKIKYCLNDIELTKIKIDFFKRIIDSFNTPESKLTVILE